MTLYDLWTLKIPGWWTTVGWAFSLAGWGLVLILWCVQVWLAAQGQRWPAMYIHIFKTFAVIAVTGFFLLSLFWRDQDLGATTTIGAFSRYPAGWLLFLALFIEAAWRIADHAHLAGRSGVVKDIPYLKEEAQ